MLSKNLYTYRLTGKEENRIDASLQVDSNHPLYLGHFPGFPITPGVCQIRMIKEILEEELGQTLMLSKARQIKFTAIHEPGKEKAMDASIAFSQTGDHLEVSAQLQNKKKVFLKFKGEFRFQK
jgi:3-hydroxyacyl-[acyl-carrier-protein] dehydratase